MNGHLLCEPLLHLLDGTHARTFSASNVLDPLRNPIRTLICSYQTFVRICHAISNRLRERGFHPCFLRHTFASVAFEHHAISGDRQVPMVFKSLYTGHESSDVLRCTLREWYQSTPESFKQLVPRPMLCHLNGKNIYNTLVRAKVPPPELLLHSTFLWA